MCSRYSFTSPPEAVQRLFRTANALEFPPRPNIAPTEPVVIVRNTGIARSAGTVREMALVRWGLIPPWVKDIRQFSTLINARAETITEKPSFRGAIRHRRCLVPADGYYEWTGPPRAKTPHLIKSNTSDTLLALAGLWEHWIGADGSELETMAIVTTDANADCAHIHDRMPLILSPDQFDRWLDVSPGSADPIRDLLQPPPEGQLTSEIAEALKRPRKNDPGLFPFD